MQATLRETQNLAQSIARGVQAMQDQALSDELKREEERAEHQAQMAELRHISQGLVNMLSSIDEDRPTILRKLNANGLPSVLTHTTRRKPARSRCVAATAIENKTDAIIERLS